METSITHKQVGVLPNVGDCDKEDKNTHNGSCQCISTAGEHCKCAVTDVTVPVCGDRYNPT